MTIQNKKHVLLIEDEEILLSLLKKKIEDAGFFVDTATDGVTGLKKAIEGKPDVVLLDMLLPKMNGFEVLEGLNKEHLLPQLPVIILSNSGQPIEVERAQELGIRDYLIKLNFDPEEVLAKVLNVLSGGNKNPSAPSQAPPQEGAMDGAKPDPLPGNKPPILIVEDDVLLSGLLARKLQQEGYAVFQAMNVPQAREIMAENKIQIVCLDIILPGIDGFTFLRELKASDKFAHIPVLILSNLGQREEIDNGLKLGAVDYIVKATMSPQEITDKIKLLVK